MVGFVWWVGWMGRYVVVDVCEGSGLLSYGFSWFLKFLTGSVCPFITN